MYAVDVGPHSILRPAAYKRVSYNTRLYLQIVMNRGQRMVPCAINCLRLD